MIKTTNSLLHWNYFLALEKNLESTARFIEFTEQNFSTYSIELAHLLLASASEVDVVLKELCKLLEPTRSPNNINGYKAIIKEKCPELINERIYINRYGLSSQPWIKWEGEENPIWWKNHNNVKHQRNDHFNEAHLHNVINSIGALLITNFYYYKAKIEKEKGSVISYKDLTYELNLKSQFVTLDDNYYYSELVV